MPDWLHALGDRLSGVWRGMLDALPRWLLPLLPGLVLALGLGLTHALWRDARQGAAQAMETEFDYWVNKVVYNIESRLAAHVQILRGVAGLFDASQTVSRQEFAAYVTALKLEKNYPGIQGIGFSLFIRPEHLAQHEADIRQEGFPDYRVHPVGARDLYSAIIHLEPFDWRNQRAFGYDMYAEPVRQRAMARARDQDMASLSGKVILVQETDTDIQPGFLIYVPVYRPQPPHATLEERRANLMGWAYSPLRMYDLMGSLLWTVEFDGLRWPLDVEIYDVGEHDGDTLSPERLLYDLDRVPRHDLPAATFRRVRPIEFGGHQWLLLASSSPESSLQLINEKTHFIALAGSLGSLLLALLIGVAVVSQRRVAQALDETVRTNQRLLVSEQRLQAFFDNAESLVWIKDLDGRLVAVNHYMERVFGLPREELLGRATSDLVPADLAAIYTDHDQRVLRGGQALSFEEPARHAHGGQTYLSAKFPLRDGQGRVYALGAICTDISERKRGEEALRASLEEKTVLLKEVHHRVKNNLQIISSLLSLQATQTQIPEVLCSLRDTQNRVRSMALLHETLYRSGNLARIRLRDYVDNLCGQLLRAADHAGGGLHLERGLDDLSLSLDQAVPCGLIINELVSNALKHAYPEGGPGIIRVEVRALAPDRLRVMVADDGVGVPPELDLTQAETLGLRLVSMLTEQLRGDLEIGREGGARFELTFPIKDP